MLTHRELSSSSKSKVISALSASFLSDCLLHRASSVFNASEYVTDIPFSIFSFLIAPKTTNYHGVNNKSDRRAPAYSD